MLAYEIVRAVRPETGRIIDTTSGRLTASSLLGPEDAGSTAEAQAGDVVVLAAPDLESDTLRKCLGGLPSDALAVLFLPCGPSRLPVGRVVEAVLGAGLQVIRVVAIEKCEFGVAVAVVHSDTTQPFTPHLGHHEPVRLDEAGVQRLAAEHLLSGLAMRALLSDHVDEAERVALLERKLARTRRRLARLRRSREYAVGRALSGIAGAPVRGVRGAAARARRAKNH